MLPPSPSTLSLGTSALSIRFALGRLPFRDVTSSLSSRAEVWLLVRLKGGREAAGRSSRSFTSGTGRASAGERGRLPADLPDRPEAAETAEVADAAEAADAAETAEPTLMALVCETSASSSPEAEKERFSGDGIGALRKPRSSVSLGPVRSQLGIAHCRLRGVEPVGSSCCRLSRNASVVSLISSILRFAELCACAEASDEVACWWSAAGDWG